MHQNNIKAKKIWEKMKSLIFNIVRTRYREVSYVTEFGTDFMLVFFISVA